MISAMNLSNFLPNYTSHPAYANMESNDSYNNELILKYIQLIDKYFLEIESKKFSNNRHIKNEFKNKVIPLIDKLAEHTVKNARFPNTKKVLKLALTEVKKQMELDLRYRNRSHFYLKKLLPHDSAYLLEKEFEDSGVTCVNIPLKYMQGILTETQKYKDILIRKSESNPNGRSDYSIPSQEPIWKIFSDFMNDNKILELVSDYKKSEMRLMYLALEYSHKKQIWYKNGYLDAGIPTTKTTYLHCDYGYDMVKAMIYLNPTDTKNGAFKYIKGSHKWDRSPFLFALYRDLDVESQKVNGFKSTGYYRNRFESPERRRELLDLPEAFRGTSHFGDDLLDGSTESNELLSKETTFSGNPGNMIIFDGERGLHRGSMVEAGERYAIQIGFIATELRLDSEILKDRIKNKLKNWAKKLTSLDSQPT